jgi:hypothetical protein
MIESAPIAWDCADDEYRQRVYNSMAAERAVMLAALQKIVEIKQSPIGNTGFSTGPLAHFSAAQWFARKALKEVRKITKQNIR